MAIDSGNVAPDDHSILWHHASPGETSMWRFLQLINHKYAKDLTTYKQLHQWSIQNIPEFWREIWDFVGIRHAQPPTSIVTSAQTMFPRPGWFPGARLNFAENLLFPIQPVDDNAIAVIAATETTREQISWAELRSRVKQCQASMKAWRVRAADRVAGYVGNHTNALVVMLAATSLGAMWTALSPDTGVAAVRDRMLQIEPSLLFADNGTSYNGKTYPVLPKVREIAASLPSLRATIVFNTVATSHSDESVFETGDSIYRYADFVTLVRLGEPAELEFEQFAPDHPVYILYSSG